ncbi:MAG TPA: hypothetical protein VI653_13620 [Steroidobacteraceae bacterium]
MILPFRMLHEESGRPERLELDIRFADGRWMSEQAILDSLRPIDIWTAVAVRGGMSGDLVAPPLSGVSPATRLIRDVAVEYEFTDVRLDPRCLMVLQNVLHSIHLSGAELDNVVIRSGMSQRFLSWLGEFPPAFIPAPFEFQYEATYRQVWVEIELEDEAQGQELDKLESLVRLFGDLCANRGYAEPGSLPGPGYLYIETAERFSDMLRVSMQRRQSSDFAFDALVNLVHAAQGNELRVSAVRVM